MVVTAPAGCSWSAKGNATWLTVTSGASGSGNGAVTVHTAANTGGSRSGTATIAGQNFTVTQNAPGATACGAIDVGSQVLVSRGGFGLIPPAGSNLLSQQITITNLSSSAINGPLNYVLVGLPTSSGVGLDVGVPLTTCFSANGDSIVTVSSGLAAGAHVTFVLDFVDPLASPPNYSPKVLSGNPSH